MKSILIKSLIIVSSVLLIFSCKKDEVLKETAKELKEINVDTTLLDKLIINIFPEESDIIYTPDIKPYIKLNYPVSVLDKYYNEYIIKEGDQTKRVKFWLEKIVSNNTKDVIGFNYNSSKKDSISFSSGSFFSDGDHSFDLYWKLYSFNTTKNDWEELSTKTNTIKFKTKLLDTELINSSGIKKSNLFITFNKSINKSMKIGEYTFTPTIKDITINSYGNELKYTTQWNSDNTRVDFILTDKIGPSESVVLNYNIKWNIEGLSDVTTFDKKVCNEFFTAGSDPNLEEFVEYSYPISRQYHFLPKEYNKGYIKFKKYPSVFNTNNNSIVAEFTDVDGNKSECPVTISQDSLFWEYSLPTNYLQNEKVYNLRFKQKTDDNNFNIIIDYFFRTSYYNNFKEKFYSFDSSKKFSDIISTGVHSFSTRLLDGIENWDIFEEGHGWNNYSRYSTGLIRVENILDDVYWYKTYIKPYYDLFIEKPELLVSRDIDPIGIPPKNTSIVRSVMESFFLTDEHCSNFEAPRVSPLYFGCSITNYLELVVYKDLINDLYNVLSNKGWESLCGGEYPVKIRYVLPGINKTTEAIDFNMRY